MRGRPCGPADAVTLYIRTPDCVGEPVGLLFRDRTTFTVGGLPVVIEYRGYILGQFRLAITAAREVNVERHDAGPRKPAAVRA